MPLQDFIDRPRWILEKLLVEVFTSDSISVWCKTDYFIIILRTMSEDNFMFTGYTYIWIDRDNVGIKKCVNILP